MSVVSTRGPSRHWFVPTRHGGRSFGVVLALLLAVAAATSPGEDRKIGAAPPAAMRSFAELIREGDALADKRDYAGALVHYKNAYEQWVAEVRELPFKQPVQPKIVDRDELQKLMADLVSEDYTDEEFHLMKQMLVVFGMAPPTLDAKQVTINLHTEEVAGFYNPKNKDMVLIKEPDRRKKGLLGALLGGSDGFDKEEQKATLSHEMVHALQDQQFDLLRMHEAVEDDDDFSLAITALIEGDATVVMLADMQRGEEDPRQITRTPPEMADLLFGTMKSLMPFASGKTMKSAPPIFRESLLFPYHKGTVFVLHQTNRGGWQAVDKAFRDPPTSTEQILHPEKYRQRDEPQQLELPDLAPALDKGWKFLGKNVMGEFQMLVMLKGLKQAEKAAAGWDGDIYAIYENDQGRPALVWATTWDSAADAGEFFQAYQEAVKKKAGAGAAVKESSTHKFILQADGAIHHLEVRNQDLVAVEGFSADEASQLADLAFGAKKTIKKFDMTRVAKPEKKKK